MSPTKPEVFLPERLVAEQRYHVTTRTLRRWDKTPGLEFPPPIFIKKRRYRNVAALDAWDNQNSRRAASRLSTPRPAAQPTP